MLRQRHEGHVTRFQQCQYFQHLAQAANSPVQFPDHEGIATLKHVQCSVETGTSRSDGRNTGILEYPFASGSLQRIALKIEVLFVSTYSRIAQNRHPSPCQNGTFFELI